MPHRVVTGLTEIIHVKHLAQCLSYSRLLIIIVIVHTVIGSTGEIYSYITYFLFLETHIYRREYKKKITIRWIIIYFLLTKIICEK